MVNVLNLEKQTEKLFIEIEPSLVAVARKRRLQDPEGEARSWFLRAQQIFKDFDQGKYSKSFIDKDGKLIEITERSSKTDREKFKKYLTAYLCKAFSHDILAAQRKDRQKLPENTLVVVSNPENAYNEAMSQQVYLDDLIELIAQDIKRGQRLITSARDKVNVLFLQATNKYLSLLMKDVGNIPIVKNADADQTSHFFVNELRDGRLENIRQELSLLIEAENNPAVSGLVSKLVHQDDKLYALSKKIYRYFSSLIPRLRKISEQRQR